MLQRFLFTDSTREETKKEFSTIKQTHFNF